MKEPRKRAKPVPKGYGTVTPYLACGDAVGAGARLLHPVQDKFYGDRTGTVQDPFGHVWHIATHVEDLSMAELRKRAEAAMKS